MYVELWTESGQDLESGCGSLYGAQLYERSDHSYLHISSHSHADSLKLFQAGRQDQATCNTVRVRVRDGGCGCLLVCMRACLLACLPACLPASLPASLLACLPVCLLACLPACLGLLWFLPP